MKKVCRKEIDGYPMLPNHTMKDDLAELQNLLYQIRDGAGVNEATIYDEENKLDWGVEEMLEYIHEKYDI